MKNPHFSSEATLEFTLSVRQSVMLWGKRHKDLFINWGAGSIQTGFFCELDCFYKRSFLLVERGKNVTLFSCGKVNKLKKNSDKQIKKLKYKTFFSLKNIY